MTSFLANSMPGSEVIFPSYTFSSTANAFVSHGATPVFIDVERDTLNLDPDLIENAISEKQSPFVQSTMLVFQQKWIKSMRSRKNTI